MLLRTAAVAIALALPSLAHADEFEALCTAMDTTGVSAASCACASGKVTKEDDRTAAIEAMKAVNTALASGKPEDSATVTAKHAKGLQIVTMARTACMVGSP
jgi:hypothetical protein